MNNKLSIRSMFFNVACAISLAKNMWIMEKPLACLSSVLINQDEKWDYHILLRWFNLIF